MKNWLKNAVFYEIYPQSFNDTNADGIGDFNGITEKLDYIKDMGFTAIWMNPCFDSPFNDAGYDVRDFYKAAERYGTNEDLKRLFDEVHKRDMRIILDLVPGHTSVECKWFEESKKAEKNRYSDRYVWTDCIWTDVAGVSGLKGSLRGISDRDGCCGVNFFSSQPALNYGFAEITESWQCAVDSEAALDTRAEILDIIRFWTQMGCDGFRVDMAGSLVKNDKEQKETIRLWQEIFDVVNKEFPEAVFVSEWGEPAKALEGGFDMDFLLHCGPSHYPDMFHSENPYFSKDGKGSAKEFFEYYLNSLNSTYGKGLICIPSGNHDMERMSYFCDETQMKIVYAFMMSMPGVPFVYYGDEIGMKYLKGLKSVEGGFHRTGARTPMQWDSTVNSGFSTAAADKLYIVQDSDINRPTVEKQLEDGNSLLNELKKQIAVRKKNTALQESAGFELISSDYPLVYRRYTDTCSILVAINPTDKERSVNVGDAAVKEKVYSF
ncbi:MAG: glycosylase, partial [Clostridia bacterium]|nr:glycosylase [Clostridia bacterium]